MSPDEVIGPKYKFSPHKFHFKSNEQQQQQLPQQQQHQQPQSEERTQHDVELSSKVDDMFDYLKSLGKLQKNFFPFFRKS